MWNVSTCTCWSMAHITVFVNALLDSVITLLLQRFFTICNEGRKKTTSNMFFSFRALVLQLADFRSCAGGGNSGAVSQYVYFHWTKGQERKVENASKLKKKHHYVPNKPSSVCEFLHSQHANAKLAKVLLSWVQTKPSQHNFSR